ncbi:Calcium-binding protein PBP1 [Senna tora]|uniref:Calcium-binding protein PBP1 n=1 Tax=Senna tora TaxID=362788 RepID=A0A834TKN9_9FABA|nr:Calcium-binding protein PBP1 [Senna tora]
MQTQKSRVGPQAVQRDHSLVFVHQKLEPITELLDQSFPSQFMGYHRKQVLEINLFVSALLEEAVPERALMKNVGCLGVWMLAISLSSIITTFDMWKLDWQRHLLSAPNFDPHIELGQYVQSVDLLHEGPPGIMKLSSPVKLLHLKLKYTGSPQSGPVLNGYGISFVPQGSQDLPCNTKFHTRNKTGSSLAFQEINWEFIFMPDKNVSVGSWKLCHCTDVPVSYSTKFPESLRVAVQFLDDEDGRFELQ